MSPDFCFKIILGLKSIHLLIQFAPDLLACQFAVPNWVQLNCRLAVAYVTMWPNPLHRGLWIHFPRSCHGKPITAHHEHGWAKLSSEPCWMVGGAGWTAAGWLRERWTSGVYSRRHSLTCLSLWRCARSVCCHFDPITLPLHYLRSSLLGRKKLWARSAQR